MKGNKVKEETSECSICGKIVNKGVGICKECLNHQKEKDPKMGEFWTKD